MNQEKTLKGESALSERPLNGDHAVGLGGDGSEGTDGEVEGVTVVASGADIGDHGGDSLSVVGVLDVDPSAAVAGALGEVGSPVSVGVNGDDLVVLGVDGTTGTGVTVLVEVGGVTTGLGVTARRLLLLGSLGGLGGGGPGGGGGRGDPLGGRGDPSGGGGRGGGRHGVGVVGSGGDVGGRGAGGLGRGGSLVGGGGLDLGHVGGAVRSSVVDQGLGREHGSAALIEERGVVLVVTRESEVSAVV